MSVCFRWGLESPGTGGSFFGGDGISGGQCSRKRATTQKNVKNHVLGILKKNAKNVHTFSEAS